ncbi:hypothetical protein PSTT_10079 [Puccinia striiformis]|uniref:Uncharacterized protein n=1 Tax=Puccinia striiformis TaxID=27350 RepID=A0A2S4V605_9BASI|nr:hypothetical protein PSTT_10079 [Puccinia striiformis]
MNDAGSKGNGKPPMNPESDTIKPPWLKPKPIEKNTPVALPARTPTLPFASRRARLEEAMIGMMIKLQTPESHSHSPSDDVNLCTFRTLDGPAYTGLYQDVEPFLLWLNSLHMFFCSKEIMNEHTKIILTGGFIKESNLLGFFATGSKHLLEGTWTEFCKELMATALPSHWKTPIQKQLWFLKMTTSETTVNDKDLAEGITFDLLDVVESDIYKLHLLEESPFGFSEFAARCHYSKRHCGNTHGTCPGLVNCLKVHIPPSFVAPPKNYVTPTDWTRAQAANRKAPTPHLPARRQTSRPAGVAGISDKEMWPEYDHMSEAALDAIDTQADICETLALDKICATDNKAILAEFGDLSFPPTVLSSAEEQFPEDTSEMDRDVSAAAASPPPVYLGPTGRCLPCFCVPAQKFDLSVSGRPRRQPRDNFPTTTANFYFIPARQHPGPTQTVRLRDAKTS